MRQPAVIDGKKRCATCKKRKPVSQFSRATKRKCGLQSACKACQQAAKDKWRTANPAAYRRQQRRTCKRYAVKLKREVLSHYSGGTPVCNRCGFDENIAALTIDHVNNDGASHRRELAAQNQLPSKRFYNWLKHQGYPAGFQVLCFNCQRIKYQEYLDSFDEDTDDADA